MGGSPEGNTEGAQTYRTTKACKSPVFVQVDLRNHMHFVGTLGSQLEPKTTGMHVLCIGLRARKIIPEAYKAWPCMARACIFEST